MILVAQFEVVGTPPVPWSAPEIGNRTSRSGKRYRFTTRNKALAFWQEYVKMHAHGAMTTARRAPYLGPVAVVAGFRFRHDDPAEHGKVWCPEVLLDQAKGYVRKGQNCPDCDNLFKATMDALQGVVVGNDCQVVAQASSRQHWSHDGVHLAVFEFPADGISFEIR